ncbi:MAG: glycine betaine ABC transporter substrate-binding protein [Phycisphaerae bacterium]
MRFSIHRLLTIALLLISSGCVPEDAPITIGSKKFTESVILGELAAGLGRETGQPIALRSELGGTRILWNALRNGDIDAYPEYTGTIRAELFPRRQLEDKAAIRRALAEQHIGMTGPLGFSNNYVLGMNKDRAAELGIERISDLVNHPELRFGFTDEFMARADGWPGLRDRYRLPQQNTRGLDHDIAYRGLAGGSIDVTDLYSTDAEIAYYDLKTLVDDRAYFDVYEAVLLYRMDLGERSPAVLESVRRLQGAISAEAMIAMNRRSKIEKEDERRVAADFLADVLGVHGTAPAESAGPALYRTTVEHGRMVWKSMLGAILVAIPLGIWAAKRPRAGLVILAVVGVVQTIPALALLVLLMTLLRPLSAWGVESLGETPAIVALFLYSLLPLVRNTHAGLSGIPIEIRESAEALGLSPAARLRLVELPIASKMVLAGIKTAIVINIGFATLGALIGAGGYGQPILTGIRRDDVGMILQGAVPAAVLALIAQGVFEIVERWCVPKGLRLKPGG